MVNAGLSDTVNERLTPCPSADRRFQKTERNEKAAGPKPRRRILLAMSAAI
jgi:hypothetical protein